MRHGLPPARPGLAVTLVTLGLLAGACTTPPTLPTPPPPGPVQHVIHISVDGLHSDAVPTLGRADAPNFFRLREQGAFTDNARTDPKLANTLPDHASELTSRGVFGDAGHGLIINDDLGPPATLRLIKGSYVPGVFDVVHDAGFSTGFFASKTKFALLERSWNPVHGARDRTGVNNGRDKVDVTVIDGNMAAVVAAFVTEMARSRFTYAFVHLREPDSTGHRADWSLANGSDYLQSVIAVDGLLGDILDLVETDPALAGRTAVILTSDHSGELGTNFHLLLPDVDFIESGIISFYVWGPGIPAGADLYALNPSTRSDPGRSIPGYNAPLQPVRNGDAANVALDLLGLPAVPGSTINAAQDLATSN